MFFSKEKNVKIDRKLFNEVSKHIGNQNPSFVINLLMHNYLQALPKEPSSIPQFDNVQSTDNSVAYSENYYKVQKNLQTWSRKQSEYKTIIVAYFECKEKFGNVSKVALEKRCYLKDVKNFVTYFSQLSSSNSSQGQVFRKDDYGNLDILDEVKSLIEDFYNSTLNNNIIIEPNNNTTVSKEAEMSKPLAIALFREKGRTVSTNCTYASSNSACDKYWANPRSDYFNTNWSFILNNKKTKQLYLLNIPANSFSVKDFYLKSGTTPNIEIGITDLIDDGPGRVNFSKYVVDKINY